VAGEEPLTLSLSDLFALSDLIDTAVENLPRRTIHWVDIPMRLEPHKPGHHNGCSRFSIN
jgi:hypothetical protein